MDGDALDGPNRHAYCAAEIRRLREELALQTRCVADAVQLIDRHLAHYNTVSAIHPHGGLHAIRDALTNPTGGTT